MCVCVCVWCEGRAITINHTQLLQHVTWLLTLPLGVFWPSWPCPAPLRLIAPFLFQNLFWLASHLLQCFLTSSPGSHVSVLSSNLAALQFLSLPLHHSGDFIDSCNVSLILYADGTKALIPHQICLLSSRPIDPISHLVISTAIHLNRCKTEGVILPFLFPDLLLLKCLIQ